MISAFTLPMAHVCALLSYGRYYDVPNKTILWWLNIGVVAAIVAFFLSVKLMEASGSTSSLSTFISCLNAAIWQLFYMHLFERHPVGIDFVDGTIDHREAHCDATHRQAAAGVKNVCVLSAFLQAIAMVRFGVKSVPSLLLGLSRPRSRLRFAYVRCFKLHDRGERELDLKSSNLLIKFHFAKTALFSCIGLPTPGNASCRL
jgi:hypothetical protein